MKKRVLSMLLAVIMLLSLLPMTAFAAEWTGKPETVTGSGTEAAPYQIGTLDDLTALATEVSGGTAFEGTYFKLTADIGNSTTPFSTPIGNYTNQFKGNFDGDGHTVYLTISGSSYLGLFGCLNGGSIKNVTTAGTVADTSKSVTGNGPAAGVCALNIGGTIENCVNNAAVSCKDYGKYMGGICGKNEGGTINGCSNSAQVKSWGFNVQYFGGICGQNYTGSILNCVNSGEVKALAYDVNSMGGICGLNGGVDSSATTADAIIANCVNNGNVTVQGNSTYEANEIGGICGRNNADTHKGMVVNCFSTGVMSSDKVPAPVISYCGSVVGYNWEKADNGKAIVSNCYYDTTVKNTLATAAVGSTNFQHVTNTLGMTSAQMKAASGETLSTGVADNKPLVDLLNGYKDGESYPEAWNKWTVKSGEYPTFKVEEFITNGTAKDDRETNHGYISIDKTTAAEGETVTITVNPADGYQLKSLKYNDGTDHEITADQDGKYLFTMPKANVTVTAEFEKVITITGTINVNSNYLSSDKMVIFYSNDVKGYNPFKVSSSNTTTVTGTYTWGAVSNGINNTNSFFQFSGSAEKHYFNDGEFTVTGTPGNYTLTGRMTGTDGNIYDITLTSPEYNITNNTTEENNDANHGYITVDKTVSNANQTVTVTVNPADGYQLKSLKYNDGEDHTITVDKDGKYTFTMPAKAVTVTATFDRMYFDLCNGEETLTEKPETDPTWGTYKFVGWYTARTGGTKVETGFTAGTTYYAHWQVSSTDTTLVLTEGVLVKADGVYISTGKLDNINLYGLTFTAAQGDDPVTLTMNNTVVEAGEGTDSGITFSSSHAFAALSAKIDLKIVLNGQNVLRVTRKVADDTVIALCVTSQKSLTLSGTGSVTADVSGSEGYNVFAVNAGNLINSATLIANAENTKANKSLCAVSVSKVLTNSGTITASAEGGVSDGGNAVGVASNGSIKNTAGTITGYGGIGEYSDGLSIVSGSLEITGGKVIGYGGTGVSEYYGVWAAGDITVSGNGILEAHSGTKQGADPVALYLEATGKTITLSDNGQIIADAMIKNDGTYAGTCAVTGADRDTVSGSVATLKKSGSENIVINNHTHNLVKVTGQAATESAAGWKDYYECKDDEYACHKYFEDENGTTPIENLGDWKAQGGRGYLALLVHTITPVNGQDATDTEAGYKPYYECKNCGKYYEDAMGVNEITNLNVWKSKGGKGYIPSGNEIKEAKSLAKSALDIENAKDPLIDESALTNGKSAIDSAENLANIENAKNNAIRAIKDAQASELAKAKEAAKTALDEENAKDPLEDETVLINAKNNVDKASNKAGVEKAKADGISDIISARENDTTCHKCGYHHHDNFFGRVFCWIVRIVRYIVLSILSIRF